MCGICGIAAREIADNRPSIVERMMHRLTHRGPDDSGLAAGDHHVFGHRRLSIIDVEHGHQPMSTADGRFTIVFNGEIYNYVELREDLVGAGARLRTHSDTEVLLDLLARHGERALEMINGMYAFALHDAVEGDVLLARDEFGVKPLYYAVTPEGELVFASEIKALLEHPGVPARRDEHALRDYLTFQFCLTDATLFAGVKKVEAGCLVRWRPDGIRVRRYWDCNFHVDLDRSEAESNAQLDGLLHDAVRIQLRSDVPLGAYLSGGLDSSLVVMLAARQAGRQLEVFHGRFTDDPFYDESEYARCVADAAGAVYHEIVPTAEMFVESMPLLIHAMDEPTAGPGLFPQYHVAKLASEHVKVVLGGQGGDELFGGYARYLIGYLEQALKGAIFQTQEEGEHVLTLSSIVPHLAVLQQYTPLLKFFWGDGLFEPMDRRYFRLIDRSKDVAGVLHDEFTCDAGQERVFESFRQVFNHPDTLSYINKMTHFDLKTLLPALLHVEDRVSMAASLESRVPLLDRRIADLITTAPPKQKFAGGRLKYSLKQVAGKILPEKVAHRTTKMGFPVPLAEWMQGGPVREFVCDTLLSPTCAQRGLFRREALEQLVDRGGFGRTLWGALCLELWHREFGIS